MGGNGWKWVEMGGNEGAVNRKRKWLDEKSWGRNGGNGWKWVEMGGNW